MFDYFLMAGVILIVIGIFTLAFVVYQDGGQCVLDPCAYAISKNISCFNIFIP